MLSLMTENRALASHFIDNYSQSNLLKESIAPLTGLFPLSLLAQVSVPLPFTPIPITGQTFGVGFLSLMYRAKRGFLIVSLYLFLGAMGAPTFAMAKSELLGPTSDYLFGMLLTSLVISYLADRGWSKSFYKSLLALAFGSFVTFSLGLIVLSYFLPKEQVLSLGLIPFLPEAVIKSLLAVGLISSINKSVVKK